MPPIINPIFTKDFPDLGRAILDTDLIVVAVPGDQITYKTTASELRTLTTPFVYFTDSLTSGISSNKTTGVVTITMASFPDIASNGIIRADIDILKDGEWYASDVLPEVTKNGSGVLLTAVFTLGNTDITTIRGRIY